MKLAFLFWSGALLALAGSTPLPAIAAPAGPMLSEERLDLGGRMRRFDVGFISAIIDTLTASHRADPKGIYITGMSNGGMMTHVIGEKLSLKVAAIAPVVGAVFGDEAPPAGPAPAYLPWGRGQNCPRVRRRDWRQSRRWPAWPVASPARRP